MVQPGPRPGNSMTVRDPIELLGMSDDDAEEVLDALDDPECIDPCSADIIPPRVSRCFNDFSVRVRRMQLDSAALIMKDEASKAVFPDFGASHWEVAAWKEILQATGHLATAESLYIQLPFLHVTRSLPHRTEAEMQRQYTAARDMYTRIKESLNPGVPHHICEQALSFLKARHSMIVAHRLLVSVNEVNEESLEKIDAVLEEACEFATNFHHPLLSDLSYNFAIESEVVKLIVSIQKEFITERLLKLDEEGKTEKNMVMESVIRLKELRERLCHWMRMIHWGGERRGILPVVSFRDPMERWNRCRLFAYLNSCHAWLILRYTFLFGETLRNSMVPNDWLKPDYDSIDGVTLYEVVNPLKRRERDAIFGVFMDRGDDATPYHGYAYHVSPLSAASLISLPSTSSSTERKSSSCPPDWSKGVALTGKRATFPATFVCDNEKKHYNVLVRWMISAMSEHREAMKAGRRVYATGRTSDPKNWTLYAEQLENRLFLVVMVPAKRSEKDTNITLWMSSFTAMFRGSTLASKWRTF